MLHGLGLYHGGGIVWLIGLILVVWAIIQIVKSGASDTQKLIWVLIVLLLNIIGVVIWFLLGPGNKKIG